MSKARSVGSLIGGRGRQREQGREGTEEGMSNPCPIGLRVRRRRSEGCFRDGEAWEARLSRTGYDGWRTGAFCSWKGVGVS